MAHGRHSYVRFYPSDWIAGTARLPRIHKSVYFDLCCYIWDTGKPVPPMEARLMLSDVDNAEQVISDLVEVGKIVRLDDGCLTNDRAQTEGEKAFTAWEAMSKAGKERHKGASSGAGKGAEKVAASDGEEEPRTKNQEPYTNPLSPFGIECPDWMPKEAFFGFVEMRQGMPKKDRLTERAVKLLIGKLDKFRLAGHNIEEILNTSVENNWKGVFEPKGGRPHDKGSGWMDD